MVDDVSKRGPQDRSAINLGEDDEVQHWTEKLKVSVEELRAAVNKVGNSAKAVEDECRPSAAGELE